MNKEETKLIVAGLLELSDIAERLDALHKSLTNFLIQKGAPHEKTKQPPPALGVIVDDQLFHLWLHNRPFANSVDMDT